MYEFRSGLLSLEEWNGPWRSNVSDKKPTMKEFEKIVCDLGSALEPFGRVHYSKGSSFMIIEDFSGDRTVAVCICRPEALTLELVLSLEQWLEADESRKNWRIMLQTHVSEGGTPMVYPGKTRLGCFFGPDLSSGIDKIVRIMRVGDTVDLKILQVHWAPLLRQCGSRRKELDLDWVEQWQRKEWVEQYSDPELIRSLALVESANKLCMQLSEHLKEGLAANWMEAVRSLFGDRAGQLSSISKKFDPAEIFLVINPDGLIRISRLWNSVDSKVLRDAFSLLVPTSGNVYLSSAEEFTSYMNCWHRLVSNTVNKGKGLFVCAK